MVRFNEPSKPMRDNSIDWKPLTVLRPDAAEPHRGRVEISNALLQRRVILSREAALELGAAPFGGNGKIDLAKPALDKLRALNFIGGEQPDPTTVRQITRWRDHNWTWALDYYLWSRRSNFFDSESEQTYQARQKKALEKYIEENGAAPAPKTCGAAGRALAPPEALPSDPLGAVLRRRATVRRFPQRSLPETRLSSLLWYGFRRWRGYRALDTRDEVRNYLRSFGSAFDAYLAIYDVEGITPGLYFYDIRAHRLQLQRQGDLRETMASLIWGQSSPLTAAASVLITAEFERLQWRYRHERELRFLYLNAAQVAHLLILVTTAYKLGSFMTPAMRDRQVIDLLELNPARETPIYTVTFG